MKDICPYPCHGYVEKTFSSSLSIALIPSIIFATHSPSILGISELRLMLSPSLKNNVAYISGSPPMRPCPIFSSMVVDLVSLSTTTQKVDHYPPADPRCPHQFANLFIVVHHPHSRGSRFGGKRGCMHPLWDAVLRKHENHGQWWWAEAWPLILFCLKISETTPHTIIYVN